MVQPNIKDNRIIRKVILEIIKTDTYNSIDDIIDKVRKVDQSFSLNDIRDTINELVEDRIIELSYKSKTFYNHITSINGIAIWIIVGLVTITWLSIFLFPQSEQYSIIRLIIGGIFVSFVPGYSLMNLLFPRKKCIIERLGLSIVLSLILVTLIGLALNYMPVGIRLEPLVISLSIATIPIIIIAEYRKYKE